MQMKSVDFIAYKQHLVRYLEEFIQDLQRSAAQIGAQLEQFSAEQTAHILELVRRSDWRSRGPSQNRNLAGKMNYLPDARAFGSLCSIGLLETTLLPSRC